MAGHPGTPATIIGNASSNFWLFDEKRGFDLTHPPSPDSPAIIPQFKLLTTTMPVIIAPAKTALVIVDMQNYFLSPAMPWGAHRGEGHDAEDMLLSTVIPAARKANIQIIHMTWGISEEELAVLPPVIFRVADYEIDENVASEDSEPGHQRMIKQGAGIGEDLGQVKLPNGTIVSAGRKLMRDQWNTALHEPMQKDFDESQSTALPDMLFYKARLSGFWGGSTPCLEFLKERKITTLLFGGINIDQCLFASLQDACNMGFDTILLKDGSGTNSPDYTRKMVEFNCRRAWGFVSSCKALADGVESMTKE